MRHLWLILGALAMACGSSASQTKTPGSPHSGDSAVDTGPAPDAPWRSTLYPTDWVPGFSTENGQLRDFSHAGYRASEVALPSVDLAGAASVLDLGADPTGATDSTFAIQAALDGGPNDDSLYVVHLPAGTYRIDGALWVRRPNTVLMGDGSGDSKLWFTATDVGFGHTHLRFQGSPTGSLPTELSIDTAPEDSAVTVASTDGYAVGDEVWIGIDITEDFISDHGMEGYWTFSLGQWRPFFRRTLTAVDATTGTLSLDVSLPYALKTRDGARIEKVDGLLTEVGMVGIGVSDAADWEAAWALDQVHAVAFEGVDQAFMQDVVSFAGPGADGDFHLQSGGVMVRNSRRVTIADSHFANPQHRGEGGNGYLIDLRTSNQVLVRDSSAINGRHNLIQNWDFGASDLVFLRTHSEGSEAYTSSTDTRGTAACSETHHALAIAVLVDQSTVDDCWKMVNRLSYSSGAGHTATESVFWNLQGSGSLTSHQFGRGYIIGTALTEVTTEVIEIYESLGTAPEDFREGIGEAATLEPPSLFDDQLSRRLAR